VAEFERKNLPGSSVPDVLHQFGDLVLQSEFFGIASDPICRLVLELDASHCKGPGSEDGLTVLDLQSKEAAESKLFHHPDEAAFRVKKFSGGERASAIHRRDFRARRRAFGEHLRMPLAHAMTRLDAV
jgi:hypothetical protein